MDPPSLGGNRGTDRPSRRSHQPLASLHGHSRSVNDIRSGKLSRIKMLDDLQVRMTDLNAILKGPRRAAATLKHSNCQLMAPTIHLFNPALMTLKQNGIALPRHIRRVPIDLTAILNLLRVPLMGSFRALHRRSF